MCGVLSIKNGSVKKLALYTDPFAVIMNRVLNRCAMSNIQHIKLKFFFHIKCFENIKVNNFAVLHTDNAVSDALLKQLNGSIAHLSCAHARTVALDSIPVSA